jgi:hypothetical protein
MTRQTHELLLDSEANLRLIGELLLEEMSGLQRDEAPALRMVRPTEAPDAVPSPADPVVERLSGSRAVLQEIAARVAAAGDTNPLDRALSLIDELESMEETGDPTFGIGARAAIRSELRTLARRLQSQDDAARKIEHASEVIGEIMERLRERDRGAC